MDSFNIVGYLLFAFVTSITPGPNNYILLAHGRAHGVFSSARLMLGIFLGFSVMLLLTGYGVGKIILINSTVDFIFKLTSSVWLLYLAFLISQSSSTASDSTALNLGFTKGFFMQFINPKAWVMAVTGASAFMPTFGNLHLNAFIFSFSFGVIGIPCMVAWTLFGDLQTKWFSGSRTHIIISWILAILMALGVLFIWK